MNYTKNYHLPQWVKSDRLMMDDFNAAMADIESGLTQNAQTAAAANSKTAGDAASATAAVETSALARLRKLGYDLSQVNGKLLASGAAAGRTKCLAYNGLNTAEERSRTSGFRFVSGQNGAQLGPQTALTPAQLTSGITGCTTTPKTTESGVASQVVTFRCPLPGTITQLGIWVRNPDYVLMPYAAIECRDLGNNSVVYTTSGTEIGSQNQEYGKHMLNVNIPLEAGHTYQLELRTSHPLFFGSLGIGEESKAAFTGTISSQALYSGLIQESLALDGSAQIALAVVHYSGGSAAPVLSVNGTTMFLQSTRQGTGVRGESCTEREFFLEGAWSGTVPLTVSCQSSSQDMTVYDVEFCLF